MYAHSIFLLPDSYMRTTLQNSAVSWHRGHICQPTKHALMAMNQNQVITTPSSVVVVNSLSVTTCTPSYVVCLGQRENNFVWRWLAVVVAMFPGCE